MASAAVGDDTDLGRRVGAMDSRPDPDARYRVAEFFCRADTWQPTMRRLVAECDAVLMDLRSFNAARETSSRKGGYAAPARGVAALTRAWKRRVRARNEWSHAAISASPFPLSDKRYRNSAAFLLFRPALPLQTISITPARTSAKVIVCADWWVSSLQTFAASR
jgi:hypothetical protein